MKKRLFNLLTVFICLLLSATLSAGASTPMGQLASDSTNVQTESELQKH